MKRTDKQKEKRQQFIGMGIVGLAVILFIVLGFLVEQSCDIDKQYLYCRLHPMSFGDIIGLPLFFGGAILISGLLPFLRINLYNPANSALWNWISFGAMALGVILIWNL